MTVQAQFLALQTALNAGCTREVYGYAGVPGTNGNPGTKPTKYLLLNVERMYLPANRMTAQNAVTGYRASVRAIDTDENNVRVSLAQAAVVLDEKRVTVSSKSTTPIQHESSDPVAWDDVAYVATDTYTYTH